MKKLVAALFMVCLLVQPVYALTEGQIEAIEEMIQTLNEEVNALVSARNDVLALLRIHGDIASDAEEMNVLSQAKIRARAAAQTLNALLTP